MPRQEKTSPVSIPVHILAGFLGSGKTSLLNHLLRNLPSGQRIAVTVNDFGDVPIDGHWLVRRSPRAR